MRISKAVTLKEKARNRVASDVCASACARAHTHTLTHTHFGRDAIASAYSYVRGRTHRADSALQQTVQQVPSLFCAVQGTPVNILNDT